jgi:putative peptide zinc metalloprotease protein
MPGSDLERRKQVRLRLRPDLDIAPHRYEGRTYYIVKDPVSLRYYRFKEQEHFLLRYMDGGHTLDDAQKEFENRFRPERLTLEDLESFAQQLLTVGLAHNESPQAGKQLFDRRKKRLRREWLATFTNILYIKIPIFDPDKLLTRMLNGGLFPHFFRGPIELLFTLWLAACCLGTLAVILVAAGTGLGLIHDDSVVTFQLVSPKNLGIMWTTLGVLWCVRRLSRDLKFIFTRGFLGLSLGLMLAAILLVLTHFETFWQRLPDYRTFFQFKSVVYLWIALGAVKIIHEFGHGLSCKAFGGEVHEMGALFLCLSPCLYCNVSDAWTLPNKWRRIIISFAGIYVELVIAAIATFVWWHTPSQPFVNNMALSLMVVCSVSTVVFNGNPLMRYDGYYITADLLEIPNLRDRSNKYLQKLAMEYCLGIEVQREQYMALWRRWLFVLYAVISYVYRWVVTFSILYFLSVFLKPYKLGAISAFLAMAAAGSMAGWPLWRLFSGIHKRGRLPDMKSRRVLVSASALGAVLFVFFFVKLPVTSRIRETGVVELQPEAILKLYVPDPGGTLERLHVRNGEFVREGQVMARFHNLEKENDLAEARARHAIALSKARAMRDLSEQRNADPQEKIRIERELTDAASERDYYAEQQHVIERQLKNLELRAPRDGIVLGLPSEDEVGKSWDRDQDTPFCSLGDPAKLRVRVPVVPADYRLMEQDLKEVPRPLNVTIRVQGRGTKTWAGRVMQLQESDAKEVPPALTNKYGGPLAVKPGTKPGSYVLQAQYYLINIDMEDPDTALCPGTLAQVKIHCTSKTAAWYVWRKISSMFDLGLI